MTQCFYCFKEVIQTPAARLKKYCGNSCRQKYFQQNNKNRVKPEMKGIPYAEYKILVQKALAFDNLKNIPPKDNKKTIPPVKEIKESIPPKNDKPERLKGESALDYKIRCATL